ncbi:hypothetical protein CEUSTIGMA_g10653.t1 [Chlamydomonas eustigma]|uniref:Pherophorin domain-containing protein n=1 Tax=Chlamydomonas eustigma TaxID=1157962 RepID=A0A250XJH7_9CHLO|nr:hypothetical protein CEUSTIGMA_g10653.t1 [Chlamydomonas eustigma]|eukprot:GAX83227.1 hypothetical protein CEUSTIGMA_g10653.t1 [Chlamydomonas eustigma]
MVFNFAMILLLVACISAAHRAMACSSVLLNTSTIPTAHTVYARTMDDDSDLKTAAVWLPRKTSVLLAPVCQPNCTFTEFKLKYGFAGMLAVPSLNDELCTLAGGSACAFTMTEGLNEAGLGFTVNWDTTANVLLNYSDTEDTLPRSAIAFTVTSLTIHEAIT